MQTEVIFHSTAKNKGRGNIVYQRFGKPVIVFNNGFYKTSSRQEINDLLNSDLMARNLIKPVTPLEVINQWLEGKTPDKLTEEILSNVDEEGLRKLAKVYGLNERKHSNHASIIKVMLRNRDVNNAAMHIMEQHKTDEPIKDLLKLSKEAGIVYRNGPWYKYMKGSEQEPTQDISLGKTDEEAQQWLLNNEDKIEKRLVGND